MTQVTIFVAQACIAIASFAYANDVGSPEAFASMTTNVAQAFATMTVEHAFNLASVRALRIGELWLVYLIPLMTI